MQVSINHQLEVAYGLSIDTEIVDLEWSWMTLNVIGRCFANYRI